MDFHGHYDLRTESAKEPNMKKAVKKLKRAFPNAEDHPFEGLGHGVKGKEPLKMFYRNVFHFLDEIEAGEGKNIK